MKVRYAQLNPLIGDLEGNVQKIREEWERADQDGIELLILPELVSTGYPPQDLLDYQEFNDQIFAINEHLRQLNHLETALLFGTVTINQGIGRTLYNSVLFLHRGEVKAEIHKQLLPTYDVFDDLRYFEPGGPSEPILFKGVRIGVLICEDFFHDLKESPFHTYHSEPAEDLKRKGAEILVVLSASPFTAEKHDSRLSRLRLYSENLHLPMLYCNQVGGNTELVFDGDSLCMNPSGEVIHSLEPFIEDRGDVEWTRNGSNLLISRLELGRSETAGQSYESFDRYPIEKEERIFRAITLGIQDYFVKNRHSGKALIGLSGGIDSAVVAVLVTAALGKDRVTVIGMPSRFSSQGSLDDSIALAEALGIEWLEISIEPLFSQMLATMDPWFSSANSSLAEENMQSRLRADLLMSWSNTFGHLLLATSNKSEVSVGYSTLYGDMSGAISPIADLWKTEVYELAHWLNEKGPFPGAIPMQILEKAPSAELRPDQKDTDSLPEYSRLDSILKLYIEELMTVESIVSKTGEPEKLVAKVVAMTNAAEYKRWQAPPGLKLQNKSFGSGRRIPLARSQSFIFEKKS